MQYFRCIYDKGNSLKGTHYWLYIKMDDMTVRPKIEAKACHFIIYHLIQSKTIALP